MARKLLLKICKICQCEFYASTKNPTKSACGRACGYKLAKLNNKKIINIDFFLQTVNTVKSVNELCEYLGLSKPSVYTFASRHNISLMGRYIYKPIRNDGYFQWGSKENHRRVMERNIGRKLESKEHIHHIDGDKINNDLDNLLIVDVSSHRKIHCSLEKCSFELVRSGIIIFDKESNSYKININFNNQQRKA